jgi:hypothetical protein
MKINRRDRRARRDRRDRRALSFLRVLCVLCGEFYSEFLRMPAAGAWRHSGPLDEGRMNHQQHSDRVVEVEKQQHVWY